MTHCPSSCLSCVRLVRGAEAYVSRKGKLFLTATRSLHAAQIRSAAISWHPRLLHRTKPRLSFPCWASGALHKAGQTVRLATEQRAGRRDVEFNLFASPHETPIDDDDPAERRGL